jgi:hypothetical protein
MNNSYARLIEGMCATLRSEVIPRLDDEFARGQVYGVINLLNTFKVRGDWSVGFLAQQVAAQRAAFGEISALLAARSPGVAAPALSSASAPHPVTARELEAMRDEGNRAIGNLLQWLAAERKRLPPEVASDVERTLRNCMRNEIDIEMKNSSRPMFAEMSSGEEDQAGPR